jgi:hypothetical protein
MGGSVGWAETNEDVSNPAGVVRTADRKITNLSHQAQKQEEASESFVMKAAQLSVSTVVNIFSIKT